MYALLLLAISRYGENADSISKLQNTNATYRIEIWFNDTQNVGM